MKPVEQASSEFRPWDLSTSPAILAVYKSSCGAALISILIYKMDLLLGYMPGIVSGMLRTSSGLGGLSMFVSIPGKKPSSKK